MKIVNYLGKEERIISRLEEFEHFMSQITLPDVTGNLKSEVINNICKYHPNSSGFAINVDLLCKWAIEQRLRRGLPNLSVHEKEKLQFMLNETCKAVQEDYKANQVKKSDKHVEDLIQLGKEILAPNLSPEEFVNIAKEIKSNPLMLRTGPIEIDHGQEITREIIACKIVDKIQEVIGMAFDNNEFLKAKAMLMEKLGMDNIMDKFEPYKNPFSSFNEPEPKFTPVKDQYFETRIRQIYDAISDLTSRGGFNYNNLFEAVKNISQSDLVGDAKIQSGLNTEQTANLLVQLLTKELEKTIQDRKDNKAGKFNPNKGQEKNIKYIDHNFDDHSMTMQLAVKIRDSYTTIIRNYDQGVSRAISDFSNNAKIRYLSDLFTPGEFHAKFTKTNELQYTLYLNREISADGKNSIAETFTFICPKCLNATCNNFVFFKDEDDHFLQCQDCGDSRNLTHIYTSLAFMLQCHKQNEDFFPYEEKDSNKPKNLKEYKKHAKIYLLSRFIYFWQAAYYIEHMTPADFTRVEKHQYIVLKFFLDHDSVYDLDKVREYFEEPVTLALDTPFIYFAEFEHNSGKRASVFHKTVYSKCLGQLFFKINSNKVKRIKGKSNREIPMDVGAFPAVKIFEDLTISLNLSQFQARIFTSMGLKDGIVTLVNLFNETTQQEKMKIIKTAEDIGVVMYLFFKIVESVNFQKNLEQKYKKEFESKNGHSYDDTKRIVIEQFKDVINEYLVRTKSKPIPGTSQTLGTEFDLDGDLFTYLVNKFNMELATLQDEVA